MSRLRVLFLGAGGPFSCTCLERLIPVADVAGVVVPRSSGRGLRGVIRGLRQRSATRPLRSIARRHAIPVVRFGDDLRPFRAEVLCTASFPHLIDAGTRSTAKLGAINVHSSLLPRHRGPDPLFWTYFDDDRESGITVHWMTDGIDDGDIIVQRRIDVPRGIGGRDLYMRLANEAAEALAEAVAAIGNGAAERVPQADAPADPSPAARTWSIDYDAWPAERVWHFLRGYSFRRGAAIADRNGRLHAVREPTGYEIREHDQIPGTFLTEGKSLTIFCADGIVRIR
jgi:methionyl-tRNA formyltransferase